MKRLTFILLALTLRSVSAGGLAPKQSPDDWSGAQRHVLMVGMVPGIVTDWAIPTAHPLVKFGVCSIPGLIHEFDGNIPGNRWSRNDLIFNSLGCIAGLSLSSEIRLRVAPRWIGITYSMELP
jgi:hypothetical protein